jgi:hypothetical protein
VNFELLLKIATVVLTFLAVVFGLIGKLIDERRKGFLARLRPAGRYTLWVAAASAAAAFVLLFVDDYSASTRESVAISNYAQLMGEVARARLDLRDLTSAIDHQLADLERSLRPTPSPSPSPTPKA